MYSAGTRYRVRVNSRVITGDFFFVDKRKLLISIHILRMYTRAVVRLKHAKTPNIPIIIIRSSSLS